MSSSRTKVLVYQHRAGSSPVIPKGLAVVTQGELNEILETNSHLRATKKDIPAAARSLDILEKDLWTWDEKQRWASEPNRNSNVASIDLPLSVIMSRAVSGSYRHVVVLAERQ